MERTPFRYEKPKPKRSLVVPLTSSGFFLVSLAILGVLLFRDDRKQEEPKACEPQPVKTVEKIVEKIVYKECSPESALMNGAGSGDKVAAAETSIAALPHRKSPSHKSASFEKTKELMEQMGVSTPSSGAPVGKLGKSVGDSQKKAFADEGGLTAEQMKRVVNRNRGSLKFCYERSLKKGEAPGTRDLRVNFIVKVGQSGTVKSAAITGEGASMPILSECLTRSVKKWTFPAAEKDSNLEFPFVFTPTS